MPTQEIQRDSITDDDLSPYRGMWIAVRDGHVIASDIDPSRLLAQSLVTEDDWLVPVPSESNGTYLL